MKVRQQTPEELKLIAKLQKMSPGARDLLAKLLGGQVMPLTKKAVKASGEVQVLVGSALAVYNPKTGELGICPDCDATRVRRLLLVVEG